MVAIGAGASTSAGGVVFDESVIGNFSDNDLAPTAFVLREACVGGAFSFVALQAEPHSSLRWWHRAVASDGTDELQ